MRDQSFGETTMDEWATREVLDPVLTRLTIRDTVITTSAIAEAMNHTAPGRLSSGFFSKKRRIITDAPVHTAPALMGELGKSDAGEIDVPIETKANT